MTIFNKLNLGIAVGSFAIFQLSYHVLSSWLSSRLTSGFNNLDQKKKIEWNTRTVSTFHALVVEIFCVYILLYDEAINADRVWGDPSTVQLNLAITVGYLISDLLLIIWHWKAIGDVFFVTHHVLALYAYYIVLDRGVLAYFANFRLLAELSTPFVNQRFHAKSDLRSLHYCYWKVLGPFIANESFAVLLLQHGTRWFFEALGYSKASKANIINGLLMTIMFFLGRIIVIPIYYHSVASEFGTEAYYRLGFVAQTTWFISSIILDIINLMWMVKLHEDVTKLFVSLDKKKPKLIKMGNLTTRRRTFNSNSGYVKRTMDTFAIKSSS